MADAEVSAQQARDHLQMVDRILARTDGTAGVDGLTFIIAGLYAASANFAAQIVNFRTQQQANIFVGIDLAAVVIMITFFLVRSRRYMRNVDRVSLLDRHLNSLFMITWIVGMACMVLASHIFSDWAGAAIWSLIYGIVMLSSSALTRSRLTFAGGTVLLLSIVVANYLPHSMGYALGTGWLIGFCGVGVLLSMGKR